MADREQVEQKLARELGFRIVQGVQPNFPTLWGKKREGLDRYWGVQTDEIKLWNALVDARMKALAARTQWLEEACKVECQNCADGAMLLRENGQFLHAEEWEEDDYHTVQCDASALRTAFPSLESAHDHSKLSTERGPAPQR